MAVSNPTPPMATTSGDAGSSAPPPITTTTTTTLHSKRKRTRKTKITPQNHLISLLSSAAYSFLLQNDLHLLPSQSLTIETLLSSLPFPFPAPPPPPSLLHRLSSSSSADLDLRWPPFFRTSKPNFYHLLSLLSLQQSITPDEALAATLFRLSHAASFQSLARRFSLDSPQAACLAFYAVCKPSRRD